jgi:hypothetical protein
MMVSFVDEHRAEDGGESICARSPIAPSTYHEQKVREADPARLPRRTRRDAELPIQIQRVQHKNFDVRGAREAGCSCIGKRSRWHAAVSSG